MELGKRVQQIKVERGISFPDARKAVLCEQSANTSSKITAASVIFSATTTQQSQKKTTPISTQTELTWPEGADTPVPVKTNCQTTQTHSNQNSAKKHRNTTSPSPPPRSNRDANAPIPSTSKGDQGEPQPPPSSSSSKKNGKPKINRPLHTQMTRLRCTLGMGYWMWRAGTTRTPSSPLFLFLSCLFLCNGIGVVCRPTARSSVYLYLNITPQPSAYKKPYSIVIKQLPSKTIHSMAYLLWKITTHIMVVLQYLLKTLHLTSSYISILACRPLHFGLLAIKL